MSGLRGGRSGPWPKTSKQPWARNTETEYRTEFTKNRTEFIETEKFGSLFGSEFPGTKFA
jgi:hypothetical protein